MTSQLIVPIDSEYTICESQLPMPETVNAAAMTQQKAAVIRPCRRMSRRFSARKRDGRGVSSAVAVTGGPRHLARGAHVPAAGRTGRRRAR
ncbi:hypothetical protein D3C72_2233980 [compost metagenome]